MKRLVIPALDRREVHELSARFPEDEFEPVVPNDLECELPEVDLAALEAKHRTRPFDAVVNRRERLVALAASIDSRLGLRAAIDEPLLARDKVMMSRAFAAAGVLGPSTRLIPADVEPREVDADSFPCVFKPRFGLDSTCTVRVEDRADLTREMSRQRMILRGLRRDGFWCDDFVVQPFIGGSEHTVDSLVIDSRIRFHLVSDKLETPGAFLQEYGNVMPSRLSDAERQMVREAATAAVAAVGICNGWSHTEVKLWQNRAWVIEIAARMAGGSFELMTKCAYGIDMTATLIDVMAGCSSPPAVRKQDAAIGARLALPGPAVVLGVAGLACLRKEPWFHLATGSPRRSAVMGPPWGWANTILEYVVSASSPDVASARFARAQKQLKVIALSLPRWSHRASWKLSLLARAAGFKRRRGKLVGRQPGGESSRSKQGERS